MLNFSVFPALLKSNMDRFIEISKISVKTASGFLKSNMDRFIGNGH